MRPERLVSRDPTAWTRPPTRYAYSPDSDDSRRAIVRADSPDSRSASRITVRSPLMGQEIEHVRRGDSTGSFPTTAKNAFRSKAAARSVFGRHRPATKSRYLSTSRSPSRYRT